MADKIYIGCAVVGWASTTPDTTVNEIRFVRDGRHNPIDWNTVDMSIANNIKMLLNIDSYREIGGGRGWDSKADLINFTQKCIDKYKQKTSRKSLWMLDNEADEIYTIEEYLYWLDIFQRVVRQNGFEVGAGNFQFRKEYYARLIQRKDLFDVLCIHMQGGFDTEGQIIVNGNWFWNLILEENIRITCTEGVATSWNLTVHYPLVLKQIERAKLIGCEDYCAIFIHGERPEMIDRWSKLIFTRHPVIWSDFKKVIKDNKPIQIPIVEDDDMKLDSLYYKDRPIEKYVRDPAGRGIMFLRQCFRLSSSNVFDAALDSEVRNYQIANGLVVDGKVGPKTFGRLILEADYQKFYNWIHHDWATYS